MWSSVVGGRFVSFGLTAKGQRGFVSVPIPRRFTWGEVHRGARGFLNCPPGVVTVAHDDEGSLGGRCLVSLNDQWSVAGARGAKRCTVMVVIPTHLRETPRSTSLQGACSQTTPFLARPRRRSIDPLRPSARLAPDDREACWECCIDHWSGHLQGFCPPLQGVSQPP